MDTRASVWLRIAPYVALASIVFAAVQQDEGRKGAVRRPPSAVTAGASLSAGYGVPRYVMCGLALEQTGDQMLDVLAARGGLSLPALPEGLVRVSDAFPAGRDRVLVLGILRRADGSDANLFRLVPHGVDWRFRPLLGREIVGEAPVTWWARPTGDGRIEIRGAFAAVRGQPRAGFAILLSDGSLSD
jgi:hypothetical protein